MKGEWTIKLKSEYFVQLHGSSLIGDIFGQDEFLDAYLFLKTLREKGQLECFKWWCPACRDSTPKSDEDLVSHVFSISFANVRKVLQDKEIKWRWNNPQSEWALQNGDPTKHAQRLLESKSRPNWKIMIAVVVYEEVEK